MPIDVIQLAEEANIDFEHHVSISREPVWIATQDELERFTALVAEECAKVCETVGNHNITAACAGAIRARKPTCPTHPFLNGKHP